MTVDLTSSRGRAARRRLGRIVLLTCGVVGGTTLFGLVAALIGIVAQGLADLGGTLGRHDEISEMFTQALTGSVLVALVTTAGSVVIGVGAAVYVCELAGRPRFARRFFATAQSVAALPSVVFGIVGLELAIGGMLNLSPLIATSITLSLLAIPRIALATRDALLQVPAEVRAAAYALGATRLQTVRDHILPTAIRGIASGVLVTIARTFGATAPLIMLGMVYRGEHGWPSLPAEAVRALFGGTRTGLELAGAAVAVVVMVHVGCTLWAGRLQQRFERPRW